MTTLNEFRSQYPQYNDVSDPALADMLHKKFYSDIPRAEFDKKLGLSPTKDTGGQAVANTAAIMAGGFQKDAREAGNPLNLIGTMGRATEGSIAAMPVQAAALKALGLKPSDVGDWAQRNAPAVDPGLVWNAPQNQMTRRAFKDATGLDVATDLSSREAAAKATGAELTPLRRGLASAAGIVGGSIPYLATGPVGPGLKLTGAMAALGGAGDAIGGETGKTIGALAALPLALRGKPTGPKAPPVQSTDDLKTAATSAYKRAESEGVIISKDSFAKAANEIDDMLKAEGFHPKVETRIAAALESLKQPSGQNLTLEGASTLRKIITKGFGSTDKNERRLTHMMLDKFDDYIGKLSPADVIAGDATKATAALSEARGLWSRMAKSDTVERLVKKAEDRASNFAASGKENAIRREFIKLVSNDNAMRRFTEAEREALKKIAKGGPLDNLYRFIGRGAPKGAIMQAVHGASVLTNPALGIPIAAVTAGGRAAATAATQRNARLAAELMRRGYPVPPRLKKYSGVGALPNAIGARSSEQ